MDLSKIQDEQMISMLTRSKEIVSKVFPDLKSSDEIEAIFNVCEMMSDMNEEMNKRLSDTGRKGVKEE